MIFSRELIEKIRNEFPEHQLTLMGERELFSTMEQEHSLWEGQLKLKLRLESTVAPM